MQKLALGLILLVLSPAVPFTRSASAQSSPDKPAHEGAGCPGPVYKAGEVSRRARLISYPAPPDSKRGENRERVRGRVVLRAVLCHTGEVTDVEVLESLPDGLTEKAVGAAKQIKFAPAERGGKKVSQRARFEYTFYYTD